MKRYSIPSRYLDGLSSEEKFLRKMELVSKKRLSPSRRLSPLKTDILQQQRWKKGSPKTKSSCTARWNEEYPGQTSLSSKARITGIPLDILKEVVRKGQGAFASSGSRPGQNPTSWGKARMDCFVLNKPSVTKGPDRGLYQEAIQRSPKAKKWFQKTKW
jgi:hypothetical protein